MGAKVTFDPVDRHIHVTVAPVDGVITLNIKTDLYSDGKEDWLVTPELQKMKFPIRPIGGDLIPGGVIGDTYVIEGGWTIAPYEADHELILDGNVFAQAGELVDDTAGAYRVRVTSKVSTLVEVRTDESAAANMALLRKIMTNKLVTDPVTGFLTIYDDDDTTVLKQWDIFEDVAETQRYQGQGIEVRKPIP